MHEGRRSFITTLSAAALTRAANDTIQIGVIGAGGRARMLMRSLEGIPSARILAVCDIWDHHLNLARQIAGPKALATKEYRQVLDNKDIDAVLIGTPDHWHTPITVDACAAGKDVYVEKPLTHDLSEGKRVIEAQNRYRRIVQVGQQQRSMPQIQKAREIVRSGRIGKVHKVHLTWNRNHYERMKKTVLNIDPRTVDWDRFLGSARKQPFDEYRFRNWRWFWDFGGGTFTDLMVHHIDIVNWFLDLGHPSAAVAIGGNYATQGVWETPDTAQTLIEYPEQQVQVHFEATFLNARNAEMIEFMGTEATLYLDRGRYEVHPERKNHIGLAPAESARMPYSEWVLGEGPRGADFYKNPDGEKLHLTNWLDCIRTRSKPLAPAEEGVRAAQPAHLANIALRNRTVARWPA